METNHNYKVYNFRYTYDIDNGEEAQNMNIAARDDMDAINLFYNLPIHQDRQPMLILLTVDYDNCFIVHDRVAIKNN